jgi:hypothetical protein
MEMGKVRFAGIPGDISFVICCRCGTYFNNLFHTFNNLLQQLYMFKCLENITCWDDCF